MQKSKIWFRADGNAKIGLGHVYRSLALAEMLRTDFECHFIIRQPSDILKKQILDVCDSITELEETNDFNQEAIYLIEHVVAGKDIIVLDGYNFKTEYQQIFKNIGCNVVCIDDIHAYHFIADLIINHAGGLSQNHYSALTHTQFCLGPKYALLRKPFRESSQDAVQAKRKKNDVIICFGGADPNNDTLEALKKIDSTDGIGTCYIVIGGANRHLSELENYKAKSSLKIQLLSNLSPEQMLQYMIQCGIAITSPSTVAFEYLSVGGELYLKIIADNQVEVNEFFVKEGLAFDFENFREPNEKTLQNMLKAQKSNFDGGQQKRFLPVFKSLTLTARKATLTDSMLYYNWANDPETRAQSFNSATIDLDQHINWFCQKIASDNCVLYVISFKDIPIGQIRFDFDQKESKISYSLDKKFRGQGLGTALLRKGIAQFRQDHGGELPIVGFVKQSNIASAKAFRSIGFREEIVLTDIKSYKYVL